MYGELFRCAVLTRSNSSRNVPRRSRHLRFLSSALSIPSRLNCKHQRSRSRSYTPQAEPAVGGSQQSQILTHSQASLCPKSHSQSLFHTCSDVPSVFTGVPPGAAIRTAPPLKSTAQAHSIYSDCFPVNNRHNNLASIFSPASVVESLSFSNRSQQKRLFSSTTMVATKLDGNAIAKSIREKLCAEVNEKQKLNPRFKPCLKIIQGMTYYSQYFTRPTLTQLFYSW
jgi:hypothetical protein